MQQQRAIVKFHFQKIDDSIRKAYDYFLAYRKKAS